MARLYNGERLKTKIVEGIDGCTGLIHYTLSPTTNLRHKPSMPLHFMVYNTLHSTLHIPLFVNPCIDTFIDIKSVEE